MAIAPSTSSGREASTGFADIDSAKDPDFYLGYLLEARNDKHVRDMKTQSLGLLDLTPGLDVLEVGAGLGDEVAATSALVSPGRAIGVDGSRRIVEEARALHPGLDLRVGDAESLEFASNSFDRYRAERLYQHLDDPEQALAEALRVLRPGGRLTIGDPDWLSLRLGSPDQELEDLLRERVSSSVAHAQVAHKLAVWLLTGAGQLQEVIPYRMPFQEAKTIERIVDSAAASFSEAERAAVLDEARRLEADQSLYGALTLLWVVGTK
jgi:ubiquinone/menaquinone biosynthesis C-methylase UbiE